MGARLTNGIAGAIIAGGASTRLGGQPKGLLEVGGARIIDRVASVLESMASELVIVANADDADSWLPRARLVRDALSGGGAAAGIHAALRATRAPTLVVAWDMPFVTADILGTLAEHNGSDVVVCESEGGKLEPLCALYAPAFADLIEREWEHERSLHALIQRSRSVIVQGMPAWRFFNVNTPDDLVKAREMAAQ